MTEIGFTCSGRVVDGRRVIRLCVTAGGSVTEMQWSTTRPDVAAEVSARVADVLFADGVDIGGEA